MILDSTAWSTVVGCAVGACTWRSVHPDRTVAVVAFWDHMGEHEPGAAVLAVQAALLAAGKPLRIVDLMRATGCPERTVRNVVGHVAYRARGRWALAA